MVPLDETYDGSFPFAPHTFDGHGFVQHFVDEGPRDGEPIVCLHGEPTWGYLYRHMIEPLAEDNRVVVPDHMGFGKSETPQDREYTLRTHTENLSALIEHLGLTDITFVGQDWGGPIATRAFADRLDRLAGLVVLNTTLGPPKPGFKPTAFHRFANAPVISNLAFRYLGFPQRGMHLAQGRKTSISGDIARAYVHPLKGVQRNIAPAGCALWRG